VETEVSADSQAALVPEFFLQPLVENAIKHGMRTSPVPLRVVIRAACADHVLEIEVRNTGRWGNDARDQTSGVGLKNLKTRLDLLYGGGYRLKETEERGWVSVAIAIPFKSEDGGGVPPEKE
jgi:LytS/YehU family sensor histidine kinase